MEVVVQADLFDTGLHVDGRHLRLGSDTAAEYSACSAAPSGEAEFTIRAQLMDCGTKLSVSFVLCLWTSTFWGVISHLHTFLYQAKNAH